MKLDTQAVLIGAVSGVFFGLGYFVPGGIILVVGTTVAILLDKYA